MRYIAACLVLASCSSTQPQYRWAGANPATFDRDFASCEQAALSVPLVNNERGVAIFGACMRSKGWHLVQQ